MLHTLVSDILLRLNKWHISVYLEEKSTCYEEIFSSVDAVAIACIFVGE